MANNTKKITVFNHKWYEVENGHYPKFTKNGVIIKMPKSNNIKKPQSK